MAARLGISREDAVNELWKLKRRGEADNKGSMWWLIQAGESERCHGTESDSANAD